MPLRLLGVFLTAIWLPHGQPLLRRQPKSLNLTCVLHIQPEGQWEPSNEAGSLSPGERLLGFEPETF